MIAFPPQGEDEPVFALGVSLPAIVALARAGAVARAQALFDASSYALAADDPAALAVKGRLLKARAWHSAGAARQQLLRAGAAAYAAADALAPAPYLAINAATLHALAGDSAAATRLAQGVLDRLDGPDPSADTPYFLAATRAEALLLLGNVAGAQTALRDAAEADSDGWDDRAVTLAQLEAIAHARGLETGWLDRFRPPASLHFAGHIAFAAGSPGEARLRAEVEALVARERIGFAFGALAAGADLIIAEALVAAGVALHAVLPAPPDIFGAQSVAPAGAEWLDRYERMLAAACEIKVSAPARGAEHDPLATRLAADMAMGRALLCAARYAARAWQLVVLDSAGGGVNTANLARRWPVPATQQCLTLPREMDLASLFPAEAPDPTRHDAAHVAIQFSGWPADGARRAALEALHAPLRLALGEQQPLAVQTGAIEAGGGRWLVSFAEASQAAEFAMTLLRICHDRPSPPPAIGLARGLVTVLPDPLGCGAIAHGPSLARADTLARHAAAGTALASETFAVGLALHPDAPWSCQFYLDDDPAFGEAAYLLSPL